MPPYQTNQDQEIVLVKNKQGSWLTRLSIAAAIPILGFWIPMLILGPIGFLEHRHALTSIIISFYVVSMATSPIPGLIAFMLLIRQINEDKFLGNKMLFSRIRMLGYFLLICCLMPIGHFITFILQD
ncbi:hypothetical protein [Ereboglobus luteus]|uniref:Uncharacterized protein n=1 Tax=Ereboglobus luteus TaxID=1796921 RepID=A0A2U8DZM3_9BACT|nr:hypothetical protein [Ereboglobus luteus]AWI08050.1 hypothetical protein CKA38_01115 [Ereboglobus luteus]